MTAPHRTFVIRQLTDRDADHIVTELQHLQREGHNIADVRHVGARWRIYAEDRRFRDAQRGGLGTYRRRATD